MNHIDTESESESESESEREREREGGRQGDRRAEREREGEREREKYFIYPRNYNQLNRIALHVSRAKIYKTSNKLYTKCINVPLSINYSN